MENNTATLRQTAREMVASEMANAATKDHERNYEKLHVRRNGTLTWFESINESDDLIDDRADGFAAIRSVITVGTGSYACNCDYCNDVHDADDEAAAIAEGREYPHYRLPSDTEPASELMYATYEDAIADAVANTDLSDMEARMFAKFDMIPLGYFDDEDEDENAE